jgi:predicted O-methyltransferase YrrM
MDFISKEIEEYAALHTQEEPELLKQLNRETWQKMLAPRMLSGHLQGRLLALLSKLLHPKSILEIGTYTGYSALCLAEGLSEKGLIHAIDRNEELVTIQNKYFNLSPYKDQIKQYLGSALEIIPEITDTFDMVFIDADKSNYSNYFNLVINKMKPGAIILSDNVLWSGKVIQKLDKKDSDTKALIDYNILLKKDPRIENILLPIRDGLSVSRVK